MKLNKKSVVLCKRQSIAIKICDALRSIRCPFIYSAVFGEFGYKIELTEESPEKLEILADDKDIKAEEILKGLIY